MGCKIDLIIGISAAQQMAFTWIVDRTSPFAVSGNSVASSTTAAQQLFWFAVDGTQQDGPRVSLLRVGEDGSAARRMLTRSS